MPGAARGSQRYAVPSHNKQPQRSSPEVSNLARLLKLLQDPETAATALLEALDQSSTMMGSGPTLSRSTNERLKSQVRDSLDVLRKHGWRNFKSFASIEIALALEDAFLVATGKQSENLFASKIGVRGKKRKSLFNLVSKSVAKARKQRVGKASRDGSKAWKNLSSEQREVLEATADEWSRQKLCEGLKSPPSTLLQTADQTLRRPDPALALVSDVEDAANSKRCASEIEDVDKELAILNFWPFLLEAISLQVSSRATRKLNFELYRLSGHTLPVSNIQQLRGKITKAFLKIYDGSTAEDGLTGRYRKHYSNCRVFAAKRSDPSALWIQLNVGRSFHLSGEKNRSSARQKKAGTEFVAVVLPESDLIALSVSRTTSKSAKSQFIRCVLSSLESVLTCSAAGGYASGQAIAQRVQDLSGTEPLELFRSARAIEAGVAVGRFVGDTTSTADPITELHNAAVGSLLCRNKQQVELGAKHGRDVAQLARKVDEETNGESRLFAVNGAGACVDHSAKEQSSRKRIREEELGRTEEFPRRQCVRWDWKGSTSAAAASWIDSSDPSEGDLTKKDMFKCRLTMKGPDVFAGLGALIESGVMKGPLPLYIRDAPMLGGKICVDNGAVVCSSDEC